MRYGFLAILALTFVWLGGNCFPIIRFSNANGVWLNFSEQPTVSGTELSIALETPSISREVPSGDSVEVTWTASNRTGSEGFVTVLVRSRADSSETVLKGGIHLPATGSAGAVDPSDRDFQWDTAGFEGGQYDVIARVEAGDQSAEDIAPGRITIDTPPVFVFTAPSEDTELQPDPNVVLSEDPNRPVVTIRWTGYDDNGDGTAELRVRWLDPNDPNAADERPGINDGVAIRSTSLTRARAQGSYTWDGHDTSGDYVEAGDYILFAVLSDGALNEATGEPLFNPTVVSDCVSAAGADDEECIPVRITVPPEPNQPVELAITDPNEDTTFLRSDDPLPIDFTIDEEKDVLVDIEVDPDDNHSNGNEITIFSQLLIDAGTAPEEPYLWDGTDTDGGDVADGIYRILLVVNRGSGSPTIVASDSLVFRRTTEDQPLVALLKPDSDETVTPGDFVLITWRDDDPDESATIRLTLDDDDTPDQNEDPNDPNDPHGAPEIVIATGIEAAADGVQDTFQYRVPSDLLPGRYTVFAYIDRDDAAPYDNISIAGGKIIIEDPNAP